MLPILSRNSSFRQKDPRKISFSLLKPIPTSLFRDPLSGMTALEVACLRGHRDTVKALLDFRPNFYPPWTAFKTTKSECQQKLVGSPALHRASEEGHLECVQLLLEHTSNLESVSLKKVVNFRLDRKLGGDGSTALMKAASRSGHPHKILHFQK